MGGRGAARWRMFRTFVGCCPNSVWIKKFYSVLKWRCRGLMKWSRAAHCSGVVLRHSAAVSDTLCCCTSLHDDAPHLHLCCTSSSEPTLLQLLVFSFASPHLYPCSSSSPLIFILTSALLRWSPHHIFHLHHPLFSLLFLPDPPPPFCPSISLHVNYNTVEQLIQ